ncbi:DUF1722 domain-containing protein, partial [Salmonella enterica]
ELREVIPRYRTGRLPIPAPLTLLKHSLAQHPDDYPRSQNYFEPYPATLGLRLANS